MNLYETPEHRAYPEHPTIARYTAPCGVIWICLNTTQPGDEKRSSKWYALSNLKDVTPVIDLSWLEDMAQFVQAFDSDLVYTCAERPADWKPALSLEWINSMAEYAAAQFNSGLHYTCNPRPVIVVTPEDLAKPKIGGLDVKHCSGVEIVVKPARKDYLFHEAMKAA